MATCNLTISSVGAQGFPGWNANQLYEPIDGSVFAQALIIDPNGNFQLVTAGGRSGSTIPVFSMTPGDTTTDNEVTWTLVQQYDYTGTLIPYPVSVKLGSSLTLTWTSSGGSTAAINGISVALNGSQEFTPSLSQWGTEPIWFGTPGSFNLIPAYQSPTYTLSIDSGAATSTVYFCISAPVGLFDVNCFAPVLSATASSAGSASAGAPVAPDRPRWTRFTQYAGGTQFLDSNGNLELALSDGISGATEPTWGSVGAVTTETTGLPWQNTGAQYPSQAIQRGFGPLWPGGQSTIVYDFGSIVIPNLLSGFVDYADNSTYTAGQLVKYPLVSNTHSFHGIPLFKCIVGGITGPFNDVIDGGGFGAVFLVGQVFPDALINFPGTAIWQFMGFVRLTTNWTGTTIPAPDGYMVGCVQSNTAAGLNPTFDGTIVQGAVYDYAGIADILADPGFYDPDYFPFQTASIPPVGEPPECPTWVSDGLGTGIINSACAGGYEVDVSGAWMDFITPFAILPPLSGNIIVNKVTVPSGSPQVFIFTPSYGSPFTLTDGGSNNSGSLTAGTYSVSEASVPGWTTTTDIDPTAIVVVDSTVSITFTNTTIPGNIIVVKRTVPAGFADTFTFTPSWGAPFTLTDGNSQDSGPLAPGTYSIVETPNASYRLVASQDPSAIVLTAGQTITIVFTNYRLGGGVLALDPTQATDNGLAIVPRYVTYAFANAEERQQLQLTQGRVIFPFALANLEGTGQVNITVWPETFGTPAKPNPYPFTQAPFTLANPALGDLNVPLNVTANRAFVQFDADGAVGTTWTLNRIDMAIADDPRIRVTGRNP